MAIWKTIWNASNQKYSICQNRPKLKTNLKTENIKILRWKNGQGVIYYPRAGLRWQLEANSGLFLLSLTFASFVLETNLSSARNWSEDDDDDGDNNDSDDDSDNDNNDDDDDVNGDDDDDDTDSDDDNNDDKHEINVPASSFLYSQKALD